MVSLELSASGVVEADDAERLLDEVAETSRSTRRSVGYGEVSVHFSPCRPAVDKDTSLLDRSQELKRITLFEVRCLVTNDVRFACQYQFSHS